MTKQNDLDPDNNWEAVAYNKLSATQPDQQDVNYYLTRLEGQLTRLEQIFRVSHSPEAERALNSAQAFAQSLRNALSPNRIDVA